MRPLLIALVFLTRLPLPLSGSITDKDVGRSLPFYPLIGLLLGLILAGLGWLGGALEPGLAAALVLAAWVLLTGGLHLDGLADSADAWAGGLGDRERTLAIMKDPYCGPSAVVLLVLVLLLKWTALTALLQAGQWQLLALAPVLGRAAMPLLFVSTAYVRKQGLGSALALHLPRHSAWVSVLLAVLVVLAVPTGWAAVLAAAVAFIALRRLMQQRLGGCTGDTAGATVELVELAAVVALALAL